jgi:hypothetical protein
MVAGGARQHDIVSANRQHAAQEYAAKKKEQRERAHALCAPLSMHASAGLRKNTPHARGPGLQGAGGWAA